MGEEIYITDIEIAGQEISNAFALNNAVANNPVSVNYDIMFPLLVPEEVQQGDTIMVRGLGGFDVGEYRHYYRSVQVISVIVSGEERTLSIFYPVIKISKMFGEVFSEFIKDQKENNRLTDITFHRKWKNRVNYDLHLCCKRAGIVNEFADIDWIE